MKNKAKRLKICIMCKEKRKVKSLFCRECAKQDFFVKLKAFRKSEDYKRGLVRAKQNYGKLPTLLEREMEK